MITMLRKDYKRNIERNENMISNLVLEVTRLLKRYTEKDEKEIRKRLDKVISDKNG